jgi:hypothetical protein
MDSTPWTCPHSVKLIDEDEPRDVISEHLLINSKSLRLDSSNTAEDKDGSIQNSQGSFDFDGEVDVARSVDKVDMIVFPAQMCSCGLDSDSLFPLKFHEVHSGTNLI